MADQLQDNLKKFLSRSRKRRTGALTDTNLGARKQTVGFRPPKQTKVTPYRPVKRSRKAY